MDWRGQGLSERALPQRELGHIPSFAAYRQDLHQYIEEIVVRKYASPYILLSHSMGGLPSLQLLADGYDRLSAAVLCAPLTQFRASFVQSVAVKALTAVACRFGFSRAPFTAVKEYSLEFEGNVLTSDKTRHDRFRELQGVAPNAILREPTYGWLNAALAAMTDIHKQDRFSTLKTPIRIISAQLDELIHSPDHSVLADRSSLIDLVTVKNAKHEIMMERDELRQEFWQAFDTFVDEQLRATPKLQADKN